jgi:hypothetical protein
MAYRRVAKRRLCRQPSLGNARNMHTTVKNGVMQPVSKQPIGKQATIIGILLETVFPFRSVQWL